MKLIYFFLIPFFMQLGKLYAQENECECATKNSLFEEEFVKYVFSDSLLILHGISEAFVYVERTNKNDQLERVYKFDKSGRVESITHYYDGNLSRIHKYHYGENGIELTMFHYFDENDNETSAQGVRDYIYDSEGNLILIQERDGLERLPKEETYYVEYKYSNENRLTYKKVHRYWEFKNTEERESIWEAFYAYKNDTLFQELTKRSSQVTGESFHYLNSKFMPIRIEHEGASVEYEYLNDNLISVYRIKNDSAFVSECLDNWTYDVEYKYDQRSLPISILFKYNSIGCKMNVLYTK